MLPERDMKFASMIHTVIHSIILSGALLCGFSSNAFAADPAPSGAAAPSPETASGGIICEANISYTWQPKPVASSAPVAQQGRQADPSPVPDPEPREEFYERVFDRGASKEVVEPKVVSLVALSKTRASAHCIEHHQSQSNCVIQRIEILQSDLSQIDFESRRLVREKIAADCAQDFGVCLTTKASPVECRVEEVQAAPAEPSGKKDDKTKKK